MKQSFFRISPALDGYWENPALPEPVSDAIRLLVLMPPASDLPEDQELIANVVQACGLPDAAVQFCELPSDQPLSWTHLRETYHPEFVLVFGIPVADFGIAASLPLLYPAHFDNCLWVLAPAVAELRQNRELRQRLWTEALKPLFFPAA